MCSLFVVLILDVHEKRFNVLWLRVAAVFVKSQVVVSQLAFILAHIFNERFVLPFKSDVSLVVFIDVFYFLLHLLNLGCNFNVLLLQQIAVVVAVVDLATRSNLVCVHTHHAVIRYRSVHTRHFGIVAHASVVNFFLRGGKALSSGSLPAIIRGALSHLNLNYIRRARSRHVCPASSHSLALY